MGMNELGDKVIKVSLIIMILLSLFLSWKIWTKPANRSFEDKSKKVTDIVQKKSMTEVYLPTKLFYHKTKDDLVYTNRESTIMAIQHELESFSYSASKELDEKDTTDLFASSNSFDLVYPKELPVSFYEKIYHMDIKQSGSLADLKFDHIFVSIDKEALYFVNHIKTQAMEVDIKGDFKELKKILANDKNNYVNVSYSPDNVAGVYYLSQDIKLEKYSYIVATQSFTTFSKAFFNQSSDLFSNEGENDNVNLSNGEGESMTIQSKTGEISYFGKLKQTEKKDSDALYYDTFQYVENMGNALGNMRYFNSKEDEIVYRNYIEGYPVFGVNAKGRLEAVIQNKNVFIRTNQETIQIPIPSEETVTISKTSSLIEELVEMGVDVEKIEDIQIGYEWQSNTETKQVVDLVPQWYVKYEDKWYAIPELQEALHIGGDY